MLLILAKRLDQIKHGLHIVMLFRLINLFSS